jgi:hypothetical protein
VARKSAPWRARFNGSNWANGRPTTCIRCSAAALRIASRSKAVELPAVRSSPVPTSEGPAVCGPSQWCLWWLVQWLWPGRGTMRMRTRVMPRPTSASSSAVPDRISGSASSTLRTIVRTGRTIWIVVGAPVGA